MSWDPFQRAVLAELGLALYQPVPAPGALEVDDAMLAQLARAAGRAPAELLQEADVAAGLAGLHGNARAKRALWPRLRALRRG